ncbi:MAG: RimK/LysX family protein, partial [Pseudomonadota bacterium]
MRFTTIILSMLVVGLAGCAQVQPQPGLKSLERDLSEVKAGLNRTENELAHLRDLRYASEAEVAGQFAVLSGSVDAMGEKLLAACRSNRPLRTSQEEQACSDSTQTVVVSDTGKMVLGEVEKVWIAEPGFAIVARVDTGASSSSLHAEDVTEFERDGDDWVRFDLAAEERTETIERPVMKYVRVYQQADKSGSRRP